MTFDEQDRIDVSLQAGGSATSIGQLDSAEEHFRAALAWQESSGDKVRSAAIAVLDWGGCFSTHPRSMSRWKC